MLLFGLAVFFFLFGLIPYWHKLHKHVHGILGCEHFLFFFPLLQLLLTLPANDIGWALTFPNGKIGFISTLQTLSNLSQSAGSPYSVNLETFSISRHSTSSISSLRSSCASFGSSYSPSPVLRSSTRRYSVRKMRMSYKTRPTRPGQRFDAAGFAQVGTLEMCSIYLILLP